ncbi:MAG: hypothetical protein UR28_C0003G0041 [Candidatus Peregrinibacteria bacterium GW2011_GWF2_33_10]|nr:MAG: hypothetical protein UR28_C0003G0041 [Candidatus Peregrinibacteria bacterium GW2011_GWF2_33_10]OGJ44192.1 MAG: hypothetical protein A2263_04425 [Candidatus Peregrinibacteria bacterium RIFOXYA2_FULL_33_21]OGJ46676.1 MAG: hypothetical protein A2272_04685 [Candidatus Peregrinibacteria bacterium RIFOXYA12_FULL_33_12]OGJ51821.1 MAG: hypothetical protein A2307_05090 [Candidatus Peregrinibacteria bacterium RIFOXYB2_FULL_33_20]
MDLSEFLLKFNFTIHETQVYTFLADHQGQVTVKEIANSLGIHITTVYRIISKFIKKGLCSKQRISGITIYRLTVDNQTSDVFKLLGVEI